MQAAGYDSGVATPAATSLAATATVTPESTVDVQQQQVLLQGDDGPSPCPSRPVIGDVLALVSAACYGLYTVLLRSRLAAASSRARANASGREPEEGGAGAGGGEEGEEDASEVDAGTTSLFLGELRGGQICIMTCFLLMSTLLNVRINTAVVFPGITCDTSLTCSHGAGRPEQ
jgi:hypothetical protein